MQPDRIHKEDHPLAATCRRLPRTARLAALAPTVRAVAVAVTGSGLLAGAAQGMALPPAQPGTRAAAVEAGPLGPALRQFAVSAGILLAFTESQVAGKTTAGLPRALPLEQALATLLSGTGLRAARLDNGAFVLRAEPVRPEQAPYAPLPVVTITGMAAAADAAPTVSRAARLRDAVQDLPQAVDVVSRERLDQGQVATLEQALRDVPGITASIGEADGGPNGDQFKIRGLDAGADTYLDGLHDFGVYVRDTFDTERIEVFKGPSSEHFGIGTSGGAINAASRLAGGAEATDVEAQLGGGPLRRATADIRRATGATSALRVNLMRHQQHVADRDGVDSDRWGLALSLGFGLGTATTWYLNYLHQSNDRTPDYGQPMFASADGVRRPVAQSGVPRDAYYGKDSDRDRSDANLLTSLFTHRLGAALGIANDTRLAYHERRYSATAPSCFSTGATCDGSGASAYLAGGDPGVVYGGAGPAYAQRDVGLQNLTTLRAAFDAAGFGHDVVAGLDFAYQADDVLHYAYRTPDGGAMARKVPGTLRHPDTSSANYIIALDPAATDNIRKLSRTDVALFASDRIRLAPAWSLLAAVRYDRYRQAYRLAGSAGNAGTRVERNPGFASPKLSLMWHPGERHDAYLSYGWASALPNGGNIIVSNLATNKESIGLQLSPQRTRIVELGGKTGLPGTRLRLSGALFRMNKENASASDGMGGFVPSGYAYRIDGAEAAVTGQPARDWQVHAAYSWLDSRIAGAPADASAQVGNPVQGAPRHAASAWATWDTASVLSLPGRLKLGAGVSYRDRVFIRNDRLAEVPRSLALDATLSYELGKLTLTAAGYNLGDHKNYDTFFGGKTANSARATPSSGRSIVLGARVHF